MIELFRTDLVFASLSKEDVWLSVILDKLDRWYRSQFTLRVHEQLLWISFIGRSFLASQGLQSFVLVALSEHPSDLLSELLLVHLVQLLETGVVFRGESSQVLIQAHFRFPLALASNRLQSELGALQRNELIYWVRLMMGQSAYS